MGSKLLYKNLNQKEKVIRNVIMMPFHVVLIVLLFTTETFPMAFNVAATLILTIIAITQFSVEYHRWKKTQKKS